MTAGSMRVIRTAVISDAQLVHALRAAGWDIPDSAETVDVESDGVRIQWETDEPLPQIRKTGEPEAHA